jgi:hypothetical protein
LPGDKRIYHGSLPGMRFGRAAAGEDFGQKGRGRMINDTITAIKDQHCAGCKFGVAISVLQGISEPVAQAAATVLPDLPSPTENGAKRICKACGKEKDLRAEFPKASMGGGYIKTCRMCKTAAYNRARTSKNGKQKSGSAPKFQSNTAKLQSMAAEKVCKKCGDEKMLAEFPKPQVRTRPAEEKLAEADKPAGFDFECEKCEMEFSSAMSLQRHRQMRHSA